MTNNNNNIPDLQWPYYTYLNGIPKAEMLGGKDCLIVW